MGDRLGIPGAVDIMTFSFCLYFLALLIRESNQLRDHYLFTPFEKYFPIGGWLIKLQVINVPPKMNIQSIVTII